MLLNFCKVKLVQNFYRKAHIGGGRAHCAQKWGCIAHKCTQLHTGTKLHRSTKQKCTTRLVHRHQFNLMPPPCLQRKSGIRRKKLESSAFSTKLLTTKASSLPLINLLKSSPLEMAVLDRLRLMHTRRWKEPWLFAKPNDDESRSGRLAFATRSPNTAVFAVLRQKRDFWNLRKAKVGQTPAWGP